MTTLIQEARKSLCSHGGRMTSQRQLILQTLDTLHSHPTAEELFILVQEHDPSIHLSTIYRTLRWLEQEGLINARRFEEASRQDRFDPSTSSGHQHFLCSSCKNVIEFDNPLIETICAQFEARSGVCIQSVSLVLYGLCADCQVALAVEQHAQTEG